MTSSARFVSLMNSKRFHITAAQLAELETYTKKVLGMSRVSFFLLSDIQDNIGMAKVVKDGLVHDAARLASNNRWYLTGDYTVA